MLDGFNGNVQCQRHVTGGEIYTVWCWDQHKNDIIYDEEAELNIMSMSDTYYYEFPAPFLTLTFHFPFQ